MRLCLHCRGRGVRGRRSPRVCDDSLDADRIMFTWSRVGSDNCNVHAPTNPVRTSAHPPAATRHQVCRTADPVTLISQATHPARLFSHKQAITASNAL